MALLTTHRVEVDRLLRETRARILAGTLRPGTSLPPERDLTRDWGVPLSRVRAVLGGLAHEGLLHRVQGRGTFVADPLPKSVLAKTVLVVNTCTPEQSGYLQAMEMLHGISDQCQEDGLKAQIHQISPARESSADPEMVARELQDELGVIILPMTPNSPLAALPSYLQGFGVPCVKVGWSGTLPRESTPVPEVNYDRQLAARMATSHAAAAGHRRIAYLASDVLVVPELLRIQGFLDALSEHGIAMPPGYLARCDKRQGAVRDVVAQLMRLDPAPNAICCSTGRMAILAIQALLEMQLRVPDDVAVVAAVSSTEGDAYSPVSLTRTVVPGAECGRMAVRLLSDLLAGKPAPDRVVLVEPRLEIADSCPHRSASSADNP